MLTAVILANIRGLVKKNLIFAETWIIQDSDRTCIAVGKTLGAANNPSYQAEIEAPMG